MAGWHHLGEVPSPEQDKAWTAQLRTRTELLPELWDVVSQYAIWTPKMHGVSSALVDCWIMNQWLLCRVVEKDELVLWVQAVKTFTANASVEVYPVVYNVSLQHVAQPFTHPSCWPLSEGDEVVLAWDKQTVCGRVLECPLPLSRGDRRVNIVTYCIPWCIILLSCQHVGPHELANAEKCRGENTSLKTQDHMCLSSLIAWKKKEEN